VLRRHYDCELSIESEFGVLTVGDLLLLSGGKWEIPFLIAGHKNR